MWCAEQQAAVVARSTVLGNNECNERNIVVAYANEINTQATQK